MAPPDIDGAEVAEEELALARRYPMIISWCPDDSIYVAPFPGLPGIRGYGKTAATAAEQGAEIIVNYVTAHIDAGLPLP